MGRILLGMVAAGAALWNASACAQEMDPLTAQKVMGISEIIVASEQCPYAIDQAKLDAYMASNGMATPEWLGWMQNYIYLKKTDGKPSAATCTVTKATAKAIGVID